MNRPVRSLGLALAAAVFSLIGLAACSAPAAPGAEIQGPLVIVPPGASPAAVAGLAARVVPSPRQLAWQERELIAFAHFGMNTFTDREWGLGTESPSLFNPAAFDAGQWVSVLKAAGMKMLIVTAKHHDGFCLWPSRLTGHSVRNSPWRGGRGDVIKDVAGACRDAGLKLGIYVSPWDRHEPTYGDSPVYNEHFRGQLRELLTWYGPVDEVWFDGANGEGPNGKRQVYDWPSYYSVIRELQPQAVIFGMAPDIRWVGTESGYGRETEWSVIPLALPRPVDAGLLSRPFPLDDVWTPGDLTGEDLGSRNRLATATALAWYPAETDVSIRPGWFYHRNEDGRVKTPEQLVDIYFSSVGRNSVLLLNVPPDKRGLISDADIRSLTGMRRVLDGTFGRDLAAGAEVKASSAGPFQIELDLSEERTFDVVLLQEKIADGQRVEKYRLDAWNGTEWKAFASGTTIGYKRLLRFAALTARRVRLVVEQSRAVPVISRLGLFLRPKA